MDHHARIALSVLMPGSSAVIDTLDPEIDSGQREQLVAYGVAPARTVRVLQQKPMTVIAIDEVELALEASVARRVWVKRQ
jgi:Fe2+ transport system protein FeoA